MCVCVCGGGGGGGGGGDGRRGGGISGLAIANETSIMIATKLS